MKYKGRRVSDNMKDARNITGPHIYRSEAQMDMAFKEGRDQKKKTKEQNEVASNLRKTAIRRHMKSADTMYGPASTKGVGSFKKTNGTPETAPRPSPKPTRKKK